MAYFWCRTAVRVGVLSALTLSCSGEPESNPCTDTSCGDSDAAGDSDSDGDGEADGDDSGDADADGDTDVDTDTDADSDGDADGDDGSDVDSDSDNDTDTDSDSDSDSDADQGTKRDATSDGQIDSHETAGTGPDDDTPTDTRVDTGRGTDDEAETDPSPASDPPLGSESEGTADSETATDSATAEAAFQVTNPLIHNRADPWIYRHDDGFYYFVATAPEYDRIPLRKATSLSELASAPEIDIWTKHGSGEMGAHIWAPELHRIDGAWYIYFAAGRAEDIWAIRIYVLENTAADPTAGAWTERGRIETDWESFSLDATTFELDGARYLAWAQNDPNMAAHNTNIYIAPMSNPWTLSGPQVMLSRSEYAWEQVGYPVNEGPAALVRNGRVFISYSASATDANYCVGLLAAPEGSDLLNAASWTKAPEPVLRSGNGVFGPGHSMFTVSPDGTTDLLVFHGRDYENINGDPLDDPNRHTRVQRLLWGDDDMPILGPPEANGTLTIGGDGST